MSTVHGYVNSYDTSQWKPPLGIRSFASGFAGEDPVSRSLQVAEVMSRLVCMAEAQTQASFAAW